MAAYLRALRTAAASPRLRLVRRRYGRETRRPLVCLVFLLPLVVLYEVCAQVLRGSGGLHAEVLTRSLIQDLLRWFGVAGYWAPAAVLVVTLLVWHARRRDRWRVYWWVPGIMAIESLVLAVPLLVGSALFSALPGIAAGGLRARLVTELGAGIYEELVFRLLLISGLVWLLAEIARLPKTWALGVAVALAALAFSLCHFGPIGSDTFDGRLFWFRLAAGVYLSVVFLGRGLGVVSGCHAAYNVALVLATPA
jgi:hypothetical protein